MLTLSVSSLLSPAPACARDACFPWPPERNPVPLSQVSIMRFLYPESIDDPSFVHSTTRISSSAANSTSYPGWGFPDVFGDATARAERFPLLERAYATRVDVAFNAGDLLYVPAGLPHYVETHTPSVATSINYVDAVNWRTVRSPLLRQAQSKGLRTWKAIIAHIDSIDQGAQPSLHQAGVPWPAWKAGKEEDHMWPSSTSSTSSLGGNERDEL